MRAHGWELRLHRYVESVRQRPYAPVAHNCALFAAGAVEAVTGANPQNDLGITLESERDVLEALVRYGGVGGLATAVLGDMRPRLHARRGDVVVKPGEDGDTLGVCMGDHALFLGPDGLQPRALSECLGCWRVE